MDLQLFAEKGLKKQSERELKKGIETLREKIAEHRKKISNPEAYYDDWNEISESAKNGRIRHWSKEISEFTKSIKNREDELNDRKK